MSEYPDLAWKVLTKPQMEALEADGSIAGAPVDLADGYIHMSTAEQLEETLARHFAGQTELYLLAIDLPAVAENLRWEPSRGGALFPHLYAPLSLDAVIAYGPLERYNDGKLKLPVAG